MSGSTFDVGKSTVDLSIYKDDFQAEDIDVLLRKYPDYSYHLYITCFTACQQLLDIPFASVTLFCSNYHKMIFRNAKKVSITCKCEFRHILFISEFQKCFPACNSLKTNMNFAGAEVSFLSSLTLISDATTFLPDLVFSNVRKVTVRYTDKLMEQIAFGRLHKMFPRCRRIKGNMVPYIPMIAEEVEHFLKLHEFGIYVGTIGNKRHLLAMLENIRHGYPFVRKIHFYCDDVRPQVEMCETIRQWKGWFCTPHLEGVYVAEFGSVYHQDHPNQSKAEESAIILLAILKFRKPRIGGTQLRDNRKLLAKSLYLANKTYVAPPLSKQDILFLVSSAIFFSVAATAILFRILL